MNFEIGPVLLDFSDAVQALREFVRIVQPVVDEQHRANLAAAAESINERAAALADTLQPGSPVITALLKRARAGPDDAERLIAPLKQLNERLFTLKQNSDTRDRPSESISPAGASLISGITYLLETGRRISLTQGHKEHLFKSSLISLVSTTEILASRLLHEYFKNFPGAVGDDKTFTLKELQELGSVEEAIRRARDSKVSAVLQKALRDVFSYFRSEFKVELRFLEPHEAALVEIFQRRNLLVHAGGIVNERYIASLKAADPDVKEPKAGEKITLSADYLEKAFDLCELNFLLIAATIWKKLAPTDKNRRVVFLIGFEHLRHQRWQIARALSFFSMQDTGLNEDDRTSAQLNYWQSFKWAGDFDKVSEDVVRADYSAKEPRLRLARYALLDDDKSFFTLLPRVISSRDVSMTPENLLTWPIFQGIRRHERFASEFGKSLEAAGLPALPMPSDSKTVVECDEIEVITESPGDHT